MYFLKKYHVDVFYQSTKMQSNILAQILNTYEIPAPEGDIFKALPNIYDGALLRKFSQKSRSILLEMFCKKGVLKSFAKSTGKQLCQSPFFNKVAGLRPVTLLKKRLGTGLFLRIL